MQSAIAVCRAHSGRRDSFKDAVVWPTPQSGLAGAEVPLLPDSTGMAEAWMAPSGDGLAIAPLHDLQIDVDGLEKRALLFQIHAGERMMFEPGCRNFQGQVSPLCKYAQRWQRPITT